ncbi:hypothetical protein V6N11_021376 [Hibiscus sabdariffa]|uniref:Uncharacterized protein n=1 Tax=Hibiscus sabdariffa TaxID=183260 RepID=A0ABR2NM93_9ROSI
MLHVVPPIASSSSTNDHFEFVDVVHEFSPECPDDNMPEVVPQGDNGDVEPAGISSEVGDVVAHVYEDTPNDPSQQVQADAISNNDDDQGVVQEGSASRDNEFQEEDGIASIPNNAQSVGTNSRPDLLLNNDANGEIAKIGHDSSWGLVLLDENNQLTCIPDSLPSSVEIT